VAEVNPHSSLDALTFVPHKYYVIMFFFRNFSVTMTVTVNISLLNSRHSNRCYWYLYVWHVTVAFALCIILCYYV